MFFANFRYKKCYFLCSTILLTSAIWSGHFNLLVIGFPFALYLSLVLSYARNLLYSKRGHTGRLLCQYLYNCAAHNDKTIAIGLVWLDSDNTTLVLGICYLRTLLCLAFLFLYQLFDSCSSCIIIPTGSDIAVLICCLVISSSLICPYSSNCKTSRKCPDKKNTTFSNRSLSSRTHL